MKNWMKLLLLTGLALTLAACGGEEEIPTVQPEPLPVEAVIAEGHLVPNDAGGSTNHTMHLIAIANAAGITILFSCAKRLYPRPPFFSATSEGGQTPSARILFRISQR